MTDGETASLHVRIPLWNGSLISSTSGQRVTKPWPGASCTVQRPGSLPGSIRPPAMGPSHSRSDQRGLRTRGEIMSFSTLTPKSIQFSPRSSTCVITTGGGTVTTWTSTIVRTATLGR
jgi:hypothetical protein